MDIAILAPSPVGFAMGGAEHLWLGLQAHLNEETNHNCELFKFPSPGSDAREIIASYLEPQRFNLAHFDLLITGKDPAWFTQHRDHRLYLLHRLRGLYDTYHFFGEPDDERPESAAAQMALDGLERLVKQEGSLFQASVITENLVQAIDNGEIPQRDLRFPGPFIRRVVHSLDQLALGTGKIKHYAAISRTVTRRPDYFPQGVQANVLYPPPRLTGFRSLKGEHFFTVSRLDSAKRIDHIIKEFRKVRGKVPLLIGGVGPADQQLRDLAAGDNRIIFLGKLTDDQILDHYARSIAVPFVPYDEDYGFITIEAMKSRKPVITMQDSGGVTEFVKNGKNGWCVPNKEGALTAAFQDALKNPEVVEDYGRAAELSVKDISWKKVAEGLLREPQRLASVRKSKATSGDRRRKLLIACTMGIFPPRGGGQARLFHLGKSLAEEFDVTALCLIESSGERSEQSIAPNFREVRIPKSSAHDVREAEESAKVGWIPITDIVSGDLVPLTPEFEQQLVELGAESDAVVCAGPYLFDVIRRLLPGKPVLLDAQNLEVELKRDILPDSQHSDILLRQVQAVEGRCWHESSLVFACTNRDLKALAAEYGPRAAESIEVPNGFAADEAVFVSQEERDALSKSISPELRKSVLFLGSWHGPNLSAVETILKIGPSFDDVHFLIVGSACLAFAERELPANVRMLGIVDDEEKRLLLASASVALNPMLEGSGSNLKMFDYFGAGIPVISTEFGARGTGAIAGDHYIEASLARLPVALSEFFASGRTHDLMIERARTLVVDNYDWKVIGRPFLAKVKHILKSKKG